MTENLTAAMSGSGLLAWVQQQLCELSAEAAVQLPGDAPLGLVPLSGDAGFRRYFRVNTRPSLLAVQAPVATEDSPAFVAIADCLRQQGVATPGVLAADFEQGLLLIEDFGDALYSTVISANNADRLYAEALQTLLRLQRCPAQSLPAPQGGAALPVPRYDRARLGTEMALLPQWFIPRLLGVELSASEQAMLQSVFRLLEDSALAQPQVWVHRDFHSRNLICRTGQPPGVIDFQDAVIGPITYDLVSLLRDCYLRWPPQRVRGWALAYREMALEAGLLGSEAAGLQDSKAEDEFLRCFDWMGLQRHIKVLGIFARLWLRDGKPGYLRDLPLVLRYTLEVAQQYPQFADLVELFQRRLLPACVGQPWYRDYRQAGEERL